ncbi:hypothetical protein LTR35_017310 [Friedmanniomyces endolithicus]|nr:hypothetical protein LTS09_017911 [Friedmanniomyces endolithicus]KAK0264615.1 hypothetical protein LTR35_017310 [Friedmanniomyces endolithicus]KAK0270612.1 hypothetical protein LTS00_016894 [Friedmanniomyces endolithicus]KAK0302752.1 hypothetical protein LTR01_008519 [Friedmanniomyces endolithicus]KAK0823296.1 hypothetical protein LTR73_008611 [Friedmanniomyces endolithicus]
MSKLSHSLKALISAPHARAGTTRAPRNIVEIYRGVAQNGAGQGVSMPAWLTMSTAATMTMNSPESLLELFKVSQGHTSARSFVQTAELMREVGLKCISFNGIPRTINCLGAFMEGLPVEVSRAMSTEQSRQVTSANADQIVSRGKALWDSIYRPFENKLVEKLAQSHPNLPIHILSAHYGGMLSDPQPNMPVNVGRVLTSIVAIACLRSQTGVGPQVMSHVFGLRKAFEDGSAESDVKGGRWLATDEGTEWILNSIDDIVRTFGGTSYAPTSANW